MLRWVIRKQRFPLSLPANEAGSTSPAQTDVPVKPRDSLTQSEASPTGHAKSPGSAVRNAGDAKQQGSGGDKLAADPKWTANFSVLVKSLNWIAIFFFKQTNWTKI